MSHLTNLILIIGKSRIPPKHEVLPKTAAKLALPTMMDDDDDNNNGDGNDQDINAFTTHDDDHHHRVAIIGAGFAGLTLANYLEHHNDSVSFKGDYVSVHDDGMAGMAASIPTTRSKANRISTRRDSYEISSSTRRPPTHYYYSYRLFESKPQPLPIIGTINLPSGPSVFNQLGLLEDWKKNIMPSCGDTPDNEISVVPREPVLEVLRKKVLHNIKFSSHVVDIIQRRKKSSSYTTDSNTFVESSYNRLLQRENKQKEQQPEDHCCYYIRTVSPDGNVKRRRRRNNTTCDNSTANKQEVFGDDNENENRLHGPFDIVVDAQGFVLSQHQHRQQQPQEGERPKGVGVSVSCGHGAHLRIGDCRWQDDVSWYDFGTRRRTQGADIALRDGLELGKMMVTSSIFSTNTISLSQTSSLLLQLKKFQAPTPAELLQRRLQRRLFRNTIVIPLVLIVMYRFVQQFEKI